MAWTMMGHRGAPAARWSKAAACLLVFLNCAEAFMIPYGLEGRSSALHTTAAARRGQEVWAATNKEANVASPPGSQKDSLENLSKDVEKVMNELCPTRYDPSVPAVFRSRRLSFTNIWSLKDWEDHTSRWRYLHYMLNFPTSRLLRRTAPQLAVLTLWSICAVVMCSKSALIGRVSVPLTPLSLLSTFVAALLTLRSNQGLTRLSEGRHAWGKAVLYTRDMAQLVASFIYPKDNELGLLSARHLAVFCWLLRDHLRGSEDNDVIKTLLPVPVDADYVLGQRKKPVAVVAKLRQVIADMEKRHLLSTAEEIALDHNALELDSVIMTTERIRGSPIPPLYTAHASRLLMFYLFFLPLALKGSGLSGLVTVLVTFSVGYAMLGLDEVSHILENPFRLMPLYQLSKMSMQDVSDSFVSPPPPLREEW